jgi:hypothetical protein
VRGYENKRGQVQAREGRKPKSEEKNCNISLGHLEHFISFIAS